MRVLVVEPADRHAEVLSAEGVDRDPGAPREGSVALIRGQPGEIVAAVERRVGVVLECRSTRAAGSGSAAGRRPRAPGGRCARNRSRDRPRSRARAARRRPNRSPRSSLARPASSHASPRSSRERVAASSKCGSASLPRPLACSARPRKRCAGPGSGLERRGALEGRNRLLRATQLVEQAAEQEPRLRAVNPASAR